MNSYDFGGPLIFHGIPTFIDGRSDQLFQDGFAGKFMMGPQGETEMADALRQYHIGWTLFTPKDPRAAILDKLPGWKKIFCGRVRRHSPAGGEFRRVKLKGYAALV